MKPVGFVDAATTSEHSILGVRVVRQRSTTCKTFSNGCASKKCVFSGDPLEPAQRQRALRTCADAGIVVRELIFEMREPGRDVHGSSVA